MAVLPLKHEHKWLLVNIKGSMTDMLLGEHLVGKSVYEPSDSPGRSLSRFP